MTKSKLLNCPECGADLEEKKIIVELIYRGTKDDVLKQIFTLEGVYSWQELQ